MRRAIEHDDRSGLLPFTGDHAYVRCVGTVIAAWGPLACDARYPLRGLETHESARLRTLAQDGPCATRG